MLAYIKILWLTVLVGTTAIVRAEVHQVEHKTLSKRIQYEGRLMPHTITELKAPQDAVLSGVFFQLGDKVESQQLLALLHSDKIKEQIKNSKLNLLKLEEELESILQWQHSFDAIKLIQNAEKAKEHYQSVKYHYKKSKILFEKGIIAKDELDNEKKQVKESKRQYLTQKKTVLEMSRSKMRMLRSVRLKYLAEKKQLRLLKVQHDKLKLYSPTEGIILASLKENNVQEKLWPLTTGKYVLSGETIALLAQTKPFMVTLRADEQDVFYLQKDDLAEVQFAHLGNKRLTGKIMEIKPQSLTAQDRSQDGGFIVSIVVDEAELPAPYVYGMSAQVTIYQQIQSAGWIVPKSAVFFDQEYPYCLVQDEKGWQPRKITLGAVMADQVEVLSGLQHGEIIETESHA